MTSAAPLNIRIPAEYLWAILSGILLALSFPRPGLSLFAWCAFVPLFHAAHGATPEKGFKLGFTAGVTAYAGIFYWLNIVMTTYGKLPAAVSGTLFLVFSMILALYVATALWLTLKAELRGVSTLLAFPVVWVGLEFLRSLLLTGFPWATLGYSQYRTLPLIQISDVTGVYGLSFLIALGNVLLYRVWLSVSRRDVAYPVRGFLALLLLISLTLAYGFRALNRGEGGAQQRVLLVQGNIPQDVKWDPSFQETTVARYERLTRAGCREDGTLIVWPESALPFYFQEEPQYANRVRALAAELKSPMVVGSPAFEKQGGQLRFLNSAFLISDRGGVLGRSDKMHLVPFGEYVPMGALFPFVNKLVVGIGDFSPGREAVPLKLAQSKLGVLVCFEGIFPDIARAYVSAGARVLVNITNDAWFGRSSAPYQHLSMMVFRAVENRVPLVRAANTGISSVIDSKGHIRGMTPLFEEAILSAQVRTGEGTSFYSRYGDLFAISCLAGSGLILLFTLRRNGRREAEPAAQPAALFNE